ncbi:unnamed protein product [Pieris brassicae]|uniref:Uncharacterized protein n=1 Tax=Pieris brassicae TaxID=7116 RepID=A0A9P0TFU2_PIEBR|nr:unnamed protein product [Pieris brassicae]
MVYESDFYTTRRPYRSNYSVTRAGDWEKVPFVPRPSLVPDPVTAFGRKARPGARVSVLDPTVRQNILPKPESKLAPLAPYVSPRDQTRARVLAAVGQRERAYEADPLGTPRDHMDVLLAQAHGRPQHTPHRHVDAPRNSTRTHTRLRLSGPPAADCRNAAPTAAPWSGAAAQAPAATRTRASGRAAWAAPAATPTRPQPAAVCPTAPTTGTTLTASSAPAPDLLFPRSPYP